MGAMPALRVSRQKGSGDPASRSCVAAEGDSSDGQGQTVSARHAEAHFTRRGRLAVKEGRRGSRLASNWRWQQFYWRRETEDTPSGRTKIVPGFLVTEIDKRADHEAEG